MTANAAMPSLARELMPCLALAGVLVSKAGRGEGGWGTFGGDSGCTDGTTLRASAPHFTQKGPPLRGAPHFTQKLGITPTPSQSILNSKDAMGSYRCFHIAVLEACREAAPSPKIHHSPQQPLHVTRDPSTWKSTSARLLS